MLRYLVKKYMAYVSQLYYGKLQIKGEENVPNQGPAIIIGNHASLFIDTAILVCTLKRQTTSMIAAVTLRGKITGGLIRAVGAIGVERPVDHSRPGEGVIQKIQNQRIYGRGTKFTSLAKGQTIRIKNRSQIYLNKIISDTEAVFITNIEDTDIEQQYRILPKFNFQQMYGAASECLGAGKCINVYPEGVGKDFLGLMPIKIGTCIIALGTMDKYNLSSLKLIAVGTNHQNPDRFQGSIFMKYSQVYQISSELLALYREDRYKAIGLLNLQIEKLLRSVIITFKYKEYQQIDAMILCSNFYKYLSSQPLNLQEQYEVDVRFAKGYEIMMQNPQNKQFHQKLLSFSKKVNYEGVDYQSAIPLSGNLQAFTKIIFTLIKMLIFSFVILPGTIIYGPGAALSVYFAERHRRKLSKSKDKQIRRDVVPSHISVYAGPLIGLSTIFASIILYLQLQNFFQSQLTKILLIIAFYVIQVPYSYIYVKLCIFYRSLWRKIKLLLWFVFSKSSYQQFLKNKSEIGEKIKELVQKIGPKIIHNFEQNRIIKPENLAKKI